MSFRSFSPVLLLALAATAARAQTAPADPGAKPNETLALETVVIAAGADAKSAFDLAQGASLLESDTLHRSLQSTLGETLAAVPGVNATYYGPGASRPIIRGLGGDRVRMLDNGVGSLDASNVSPDHNVSVEPLLVDRIEVLRGPATLLYGSSAVGGVVNVIDNRIPSAAPAQPFGGRIEARQDSASNEETGIFALTAGGPAFALQANGLRTEADDVDIPGYGDPSNPVHKGTLVNSAISTKSGSVGGTYFWAKGNAGVAVSEYDTVYGVPVGEPIAIDMKQRRLDFRSEITDPFVAFKSAKIRFGLADYTHAEVDTTTGLPNTTFKNKAWEGRVDLAQQDVGNLTGTVGFQASRSDFSAVGEEVVTPATLTNSQALFVLESYKLNPVLTFQFGGRYEHQSIKLGDVDPLLPAYPGYAASTGGKRDDHGFSLSTGLVWYPAKDYSVGLSVAYSQRLPVAQELFSNGPHGGTNAYEIGSSGLDRENSVGVDFTVRRRAGFVTGTLGAFVNRFSNFVFEQRDPKLYFDEDSGAFLPYPVVSGVEFLPIYQFVARDAVFYGGEADLTFHLLENESSHLHLDLTSDYVHAQQTTDDEPLPRIPPLRMGAGLRYEHGRWTAGANVRHAFRQDRVASEETETAGYTLVGADLSYRWPVGKSEWELFARGTNLADEDARVSTSFLKDVAPLPGRSITTGVRVTF
jgi:iron complex outermembrane receptor protein